MPIRIAPAQPTIGRLSAGSVDSIVTSEDARYVILRRLTRNEGLRSTLYDVESGKEILGGVRSIEVASDGRVALASIEGEATLVELPSGVRRTLPGDASWAAPVGSRFAWSVDEEILRSWRLDTLEELPGLPSPPIRAAIPGAHRPSFSKSLATKDSRLLAILDVKFALHLLDLEANRVEAVIPGKVREIPEELLLAHDGATALAMGSKGTMIVFDLVKRSVRSTLVKGTLLAAPKVFAWLDDGRLVVEGRLLDVVDLSTGKRRAIGAGKRDPNRERILGILPLPGNLVLILIRRITDSSQPFMTEPFFEIWNVDAGTCVAKHAADGVVGPMTFVRSTASLFVATESDESNESSWCAYELTGLTDPTGLTAGTRSASKRAAPKKVASKTVAKKHAGKANGKTRSLA